MRKMDKKELNNYKIKYRTLNDMEKIRLRKQLWQDIEHHTSIIKNKSQLIKLLIN